MLISILKKACEIYSANITCLFSKYTNKNIGGKSMKKRLMTLAMVLFAGILFIPTAYAHALYGTIEEISASDSVKSSTYEITPNNGEAENVTITYSDVKLKEVGAGSLASSSEGRPNGYGWVGFSVKNPDTTSSPKFTRTANVTLPSDIANHVNTPISGNDNYYVPVSEDLLKQATEKGVNLTYTYEFNWDGNTTQTIVVVINPKTVELSDQTDKTIWTEETYNEVVKAANATTTESTVVAQSDDVPKTGDSLPIALVGIVLLSALSGIYTFKQIKE